MPFLAFLKAIPLILTALPDLLKLLGVVKELNDIAPGWRKTIEAIPDVIKTVESAKTYADYETALDKLSAVTHGLLDATHDFGSVADKAESLLNKRK